MPGLSPRRTDFCTFCGQWLDFTGPLYMVPSVPVVPLHFVTSIQVDPEDRGEEPAPLAAGLAVIGESQDAVPLRVRAGQGHVRDRHIDRVIRGPLCLLPLWPCLPRWPCGPPVWNRFRSTGHRHWPGRLSSPGRARLPGRPLWSRRGAVVGVRPHARLPLTPNGRVECSIFFVPPGGSANSTCRSWS